MDFSSLFPKKHSYYYIENNNTEKIPEIKVKKLGFFSNYILRKFLGFYKETHREKLLENILARGGSVSVEKKDFSGITKLFPLSNKINREYEYNEQDGVLTLSSKISSSSPLLTSDKNKNGSYNTAITSSDHAKNKKNAQLETVPVDSDRPKEVLPQNEEDNIGMTPLLQAIMNNKLDEVQNLLQTGKVDINYQNKRGITPLFWAIQCGHHQIIHFLLRNGADKSINIPNNEGKLPLSLAAEKKNYKLVKLLIEKKAEVNPKDNYDSGPLISAISSGDLDIIKLLIDHGRINENDDDKNLIILAKAASTSIDILKFFIDNHIDINTFNNKEFNIFLLLKKGYDSGIKNQLEIAQLLLDKGCNIDKIDDKHKSNLFLMAIQKSDFKFAEFLIEKGVDINYENENENGLTPLLIGIKEYRSDITKFLIEKGVNINYENKDGLTPLLFARENFDHQAIQLLIEKGVNINYENKNGLTPLLFATKQGYTNFAELLIKNGANINQKTAYINDEGKGGFTPLLMAISQGHLEIVNFLIKEGANINDHASDESTSLHIAASQPKLEIVKRLMELQKDSINAKNKDEFTPLLTAISQGHFEIVEFLINNGANINDHALNGSTPLGLALSGKNNKIIKLLLSNGADINEIGSDGDTYLTRAINEDNHEIVELLIKNGADVEKMNSNGFNPLHLAISLKREQIIFIFTEEIQGFINKLDKNALAPLSRAIIQREVKIAEFLIEKGANITTNAFELALLAQNKKMIKLLLNKGYDINKENDKELTPLLIAIDKGNLDITKFLIEEGADIETENSQGLTPLLTAIDKGNLDIAELLIEKGALTTNVFELALSQKNEKVIKFLISKRADIAMNVLESALLQRNDEKIKLLLSHGVDINAKNSNGSTLLLKAVNEKNMNFAEYLISKRANIEMNVLESALLQRNEEMIKLLLSHGANINAKDSNGSTLLSKAIINQQDLNFIEYLIQNKANINETDFHSAISLKNKEIVELLINGKTNINSKHSDKSNPILTAIGIKNFEVVKFLIENEANVNVIGQNGFSPLLAAIDEKDDKIVELLLNNGANFETAPSDLNSDKPTPLELAILIGNKTIINLLISKGADINKEDANKLTPFLRAINRGDTEMVEFLIKNQAQLQPEILTKAFELVLSKKNKELITLLIDNGADINKKNNEEFTPLLMAINQGDVNLAKFLIENGASLEVTDPNGASALKLASLKKNPSMIQFFVDKGLINQKDSKELTPLVRALQEEDMDFAKFLIENGVDINSPNEDGLTLLHLAVLHEDKKMITSLIDLGADKEILSKDAYVLTPLLMAVHKNKKEIVDLLIEKGTNVNTVDNEKNSPISIAIKMNSSIGIIKLLVENGLKLEKENAQELLLILINRNDRETLNLLINKELVNINELKIQSIISNVDNKTIELLTNRGALVVDINEKNEDNVTPLEEAISNNEYIKIEKLLTLGADITAKNKEGKSLIEMMMMNNNLSKKLPFFIEILDKKNETTVLQEAIERNDKDLIELLINKLKVDVNVRNTRRETALFYAVREENENAARDLVKQLLEAGADINAKNKYESTPLLQAIYNDRLEIANLLVAEKKPETKIDFNGQGFLVLREKIHEKNEGMIEFLIKHGVDVNAIKKASAIPDESEGEDVNQPAGIADKGLGLNFFYECVFYGSFDRNWEVVKYLLQNKKAEIQEEMELENDRLLLEFINTSRDEELISIFNNSPFKNSLLEKIKRNEKK